ncbi:hypothetical protein [Methylobacterium sp. WCS2018Hpa-22]|uniref:hypothetical protein n=1 Tax=Methylobacterium sp. WCS2018Hpa-22 TaxID=3073633 RepID=UPI0028896658|nr:hypothetical protein [Methylobacterium sp. WCS2018Hpa-22]
MIRFGRMARFTVGVYVFTSFAPMPAQAEQTKTPAIVTKMLMDIEKIGVFAGADLKPASVDCVPVGKGTACLASYGSGTALTIATKSREIVAKQWVITKSTSVTGDQAKAMLAFMIANNIVPDEWKRVTSLGGDCLRAPKADAQTHAVKSTRGSTVISFEPTGTGCVAQNAD